ncbi:MAG: cation diffusion facilitator family transporter [Burkholderiales bacterium]|nr:cation diffusion facilitator family transporter [Burkholderiales bacterium]
MRTESLTRYAWLSIAAAVATIGLKTVAWWATGSVGLLSDAIESLVNLAAAIVALWMLKLAERPPDEEHAYGYSKAEYFSSGFEGGLIFIAALAIVWTAIQRLMAPQPLEHVGIGLAISAVASLINLGVAVVLLRVGKRFNSITLEADAHHLMTDVWTSAGVVLGVGAVALTGWQRLDPIIAIVVALNILWMGFRLIRRSARGLLDRALPAQSRDAIHAVLARYEQRGIAFHALMTRQAAGRNFASVHVLVPGAWSVQQGHDLVEEIERDIRAAVPGTSVITHLEPREDPKSLDDVALDR